MDFLTSIKERAKKNKKTIVLPEAYERRTLDAADMILKEDIADLILVGNREKILEAGKGCDLSKATIIDPETYERMDEVVAAFCEARKSKGLTPEEALKTAKADYTYFGVLLVKIGVADGMVSGANHSTADTVRPALQIIKSAHKDRSVSSALILVANDKPYIFSDCAIIINPSEQELADMALASSETALKFGLSPKVAMLSYSTRGSGSGGMVDKVRNATKLAQDMLLLDEYKSLPIMIDGEMQADAALDAVVAKKKAPDSRVAGQANVLIFPCLEVGNISYKLLQRLCGCEAYGPMLQGLNAPVNDLSRGALAEDIVGMIAITAIQATK